MQQPSKRAIDVCVMSDLHLGTFGCHATEVVQYLKSITPKILVLNGDIINIWQFRKKYFPAAHMQVIREIFKLMENGTQVYYITGNHAAAIESFGVLVVNRLDINFTLILSKWAKKDHRYTKTPDFLRTEEAVKSFMDSILD